MFILQTVHCGGIEIESIIPSFISNVVKIIQFGIPIVLVILGMIDLGKAVMSNDDKEMKGAQSKLIKRVVYAILIFFIVAIVKFVFGVFSDSSGEDYRSCIDCFIFNRCE